MAISLYFGLPGAGKSTLLASHALMAINKKGKYKKYQNVYVNTPDLDISGLIHIENLDLGKYDIRDGLVLIDEATIAYDSRDYKNHSKDFIQYMLLHRHYNVDIELFSQQWDGVDRKIRIITDRVFYLYKGLITGKWVTKYYRIPYGIIIPDGRKQQNGSNLGEIIQGYCKPNIIERIFAHRLWRPKYYKYFDSWDCPTLEQLPDDRFNLQLEEFEYAEYQS